MIDIFLRERNEWKSAECILQSGNVIQGVAGVITTSICGGRRPVKYPIPMHIKIWVWRKLSGLLSMNLGVCMYTYAQSSFLDIVFYVERLWSFSATVDKMV